MIFVAGNERVLAVQMSWARFCSSSETPMAVISSEMRGAERTVRHLLDDDRQRHATDDRQQHGQRRVYAGGNGQQRDVAADHDDVAVRKVEQHDDAVYHAVPERHKRVDAAEL